MQYARPDRDRHRGLGASVYRLIAAQFASALADNALLIVTIALLYRQGMPGWWAPLLKLSSTLSYVLLAPFVGPLADAWPKARVMAWTNALKALGVLGLLLGGPPLLTFAIVGLGAAAYAPAKYGLLTELVPAPRLVLANCWLEVTVVGAVLLGTVLGGALVSDSLRGMLSGAVSVLAAAGLQDWALASRDAMPIVVVLAVYGASAALNVGIPDSGARYPLANWHPFALLTDLVRSQRRLWADRDGALSLSVTTLFWGVGALLQFAVLRWAVDELDLPLSQAAYLQAAVAVGVVGGASLAGRWVPLRAARRVLPLGVALGLLLPLAAQLHTVGPALGMLVLVGAVGGFLVVPMNALLQHRGCMLLSAGRSIAVQNFNENLSILLMLSAYAALLAVPVAIVPMLTGLGIAMAAAMLLLLWREWRRRGLVPVSVV